MDNDSDDDAIMIMMTMDYMKAICQLQMQIVHMIGCDTGKVICHHDKYE